jgi:VanZ family protein
LSALQAAKVTEEPLIMARIFRSAATRRLAGFAAIALMLAIAILSLLPSGDLPPVEGSDKLKHFIAYSTLGLAFAIWAGPGRALRAFVLTIGYGALMEIAQALAPTGREASLLDERANALGAGLGTLVALVLRRL